MIIICSGCKNMVSQKMYGFYWATLYYYLSSSRTSSSGLSGRVLREEGCRKGTKGVDFGNGVSTSPSNYGSGERRELLTWLKMNLAHFSCHIQC